MAKTELQLVGVTAMFIASKYEEKYVPVVGDFVYITCMAYSSAEIIQKERDMLKALEYSFVNPLCLHFLRRYTIAGHVSTSVYMWINIVYNIVYELLNYN